MSWHIQWDTNFDLARGGIELSFRNRKDMSLLLVETEPIRTVNKIIDQITSSHLSPRQHIIGTRGFGKSTLLNYIAFRLFETASESKAIPVFVSLFGVASNEKELEFVFFRSLLEGLLDIPSDFEIFNLRQIFPETSSRLGQARFEFRKRLRDLGEVSIEYVYTAFENQLKHLKGTFKRIVFLIDGLDKQDRDVVLRFFRNTQERLNSNIISKYGCMLVDAADPSWRETLDTKEFSGVRGTTISLRVWTVDEVEALIKRRLEAIGIYAMPFDRKALEILVEDFQGNPREILQYATALMHYSAKEKLGKIGSGVARSVIWTNDSKEHFFNRIVTDKDARYAFEKLRPIYSERQIMNILTATYNQRGQRISRNLNYEARSSIGITLTDNDYRKFLDILVNRGCLRPSKIQNYLELENDIDGMFDFVIERGQSLVALSVVLGELEFRVKDVVPPLEEEIAVKNEIRRVFEKHPSDWLNYKKCRQYLFSDPRVKKKLEERYKDACEKVITSTIPLIIHKLAEEGRLMHDRISSVYRWRPPTIDFQTADAIQSKEVLDSVDLAEQAIAEQDFERSAELSKKVLMNAFSQIDGYFESRLTSRSINDRVTFLESLDIDVSTPFPLKLLLSSSAKGPEIDEARVLLRSAILFARRIIRKSQDLKAFEPKNQEILNKLQKCKTGISKENEREYFRKFLLPMLRRRYGKLLEFMKALKTEEGILEKIPATLGELRDSKQVLSAELYECPVCRKRTIVSAPKVDILNCPDHRVPLNLIKSGYTLSHEAYQAWNVWMEEYTKKVLEDLPCKHVETGVTLRPLNVVGVTSPEEVDLVVVFDGKSIAVECMEDVIITEKRNDVTRAIYKMESLDLFDFLILVYQHVEDVQAFNATTKKTRRFLFPILVQSPNRFKTQLQRALEKIKTIE